MTGELFFSDFECFAEDWLFVARRQRDGETVAVWNDVEEVQDFCRMFRPTLVGFNYRDYDQWLLKAVLLGWTPEQVHHVSHTIITSDDRSHVWALFQGYPWVNLPPLIDLWPDITPRQSLKSIEAMIGMSIVESSVDFDIDRPLTQAERDEVLLYCLHDVEATEKLYDLRFNYLTSKANLCEMRGVDPLTMLKHTNARIVSEVIGAERMVDHPKESYEVPANVDLTAIPADVLDYVRAVNTENCTDTDFPGLEFMFHDCPTIVGLGGIHAAVPKYKETATDDRVILIQDIGSYYPSLIINNGYMSRAVSDASVYQQFYDMRMQAKATGDKATADAAKLVLNTTYGATKDHYNKLFDPMQATRVCLSGQLYILDLIEQLFRAVPSLVLIQLNTDGWVVSLEEGHRTRLDEAVAGWMARTGFTVDTQGVETIVQANVNNYILRTTDGEVKAKGGTVACHKGPDLFYQMPQIIRNNNTIIDKAVVDLLLDGTPIEDTIAACDDLERFQIIAKAGRTFKKVIHVDGEYDSITDIPFDVEVQRVNRVYATTLDQYGGIFKLKLDENGEEVGRSRIPLTPEHCFIDNENAWKDRKIGLTQLDKSWYVSLAKRKAHEFVTRSKKEREQMSEVTEETNELQQPAEEKPKPTRRKAAPSETPAAEPVPDILPFRVRLLELQRAMLGIASKVKFDGVVSNINYEYADTQQYKMMLGQACAALDLLFKLDIECEFLGIITPEAKDKPTYGSQADGLVTISDAHSDAYETYSISGFGSNVQSGYCNGAAQTNALRNFILNNYNLDNKGREGDDQAFNGGDTPAAKNGYVSPEAKAAVKQGIKDDKAEEASYATDLFAKALFDKIAEVRAIEGLETKFSTLLSTHYADGAPKLGDNGKSTLTKTEAVKALTKAEEYIATAGTGE